ncbi:sugar transferase [Alsobacter sp. SYSU BS001988]
MLQDPDCLFSGDQIRPERLKPRSPAYDLFKRMADVALVVIVAPAACLVVAFAALAILLLMGRPVFFVQDRVGLRGRVFKMVKLRSMSNPEKASCPANATLCNDPRVTRLGRLLRTSHVDELPQLWNIATGDMTLIGPRPEQPHLVALYESHIPGYGLRHEVKPGLSGWSQVRYGYAADLHETRQKVQYDFYYLENYGLWLDIKIMVLTCLVYLNPRYVR